jgi:hypothetical protein
MIANEVIGRKHKEHDIVAVAALGPQRRERDGRRRIAAEWFQQVRHAFGKLPAMTGVGVLRVNVILVTVTSSATPGSASARAAVFASSVSPSGSGIDGFGAVSRDSGHSRVPAPPERTTGTMRTGGSGEDIGGRRD